MTNSTQNKRLTPGFTIVIPAYNEEGGIGNVLRELTEEYGDHAEIIVVDDGSTDKTASIVSGYPSVRLLIHKANYGYGAALKTGIYMAKNEIICLFDADSQHFARDIQRIVMELADADVVIGSRGLGRLTNLLRAPGKLALQLVSNFLVGKRIPDLNSGLRAVRRHHIIQYFHLMPDGFSASTNMTLIFMLKRYSVKFIPISIQKRIGKSQVKIFKDGYNVFLSILRIVVLHNPLKFFIPVSLLFLCSGLSYGIYKVLYGTQGLSVGAFLLLFIGVMSVFFGLLADQISTMRGERSEDIDAICHSRLKDKPER